MVFIKWACVCQGIIQTVRITGGLPIWQIKWQSEGGIMRYTAEMAGGVLGIGFRGPGNFL